MIPKQEALARVKGIEAMLRITNDIGDDFGGVPDAILHEFKTKMGYFLESVQTTIDLRRSSHNEPVNRSCFDWS